MGNLRAVAEITAFRVVLWDDKSVTKTFFFASPFYLFDGDKCDNNKKSLVFAANVKEHSSLCAASLPFSLVHAWRGNNSNGFAPTPTIGHFLSVLFLVIGGNSSSGRCVAAAV